MGTDEALLAKARARVSLVSASACAIAALAAVVAITAACSSSNGSGPAYVAPEPTDDSGTGDDGGTSLGLDPDTGTARCAAPQATVTASCTSPVPVTDAQPTDDDAGDDDAGDAGPEDPDSVYLDPVAGNDSDDDQCKYHVRWSSTALAVAQPVTFTLEVNRLTDRTSVTGGGPRIEAFLDETHVLAVTGQKSVESAPGHYTVGPIAFDAPGTWTVRFHLFDACTEDLPDSPVGHVAFLVDVK